MRGGVLITDGIFTCSSGFEATRNGRTVLLTAGHCFALNRPVVHGAVAIGAVQQRDYTNLGNQDAAQLSQTQGALTALPWQRSNWIYRNESNRAWAITARAGLHSEQVGDPICRTGITTAEQCQEVTAVNITVQATGGPLIAGQVRTNVCALPGDSGGPFYNNRTGHGLTSTARFTTDGQGRRACYPKGDANRTSTFSPLRQAELDFGLTVNTS
jgi:hypothetical protein